MITPGQIRQALLSKSLPDGPHRIVYDKDGAHVCSEPVQVREARPELIAHAIGTRVRTDEANLGRLVHQIYDGLENRSAVRRESPDIIFEHGEEATVETAQAMDERAPEEVTRLERNRRLTELKARARSSEDAVAAALGFEFWSLGIQLLFAVEENPPSTTENS